MSEAPTAKAVLEYLTKAVVSDPDGVNIEEGGGDGSVSFDVTVTDGDLGRVIGRRGRTAQAIRVVSRAAAVRDQASVEVEFVD